MPLRLWGKFNYLNWARQARLSLALFFSMHVVMRDTFGMNSRQSRKASSRQALRCSRVPAASEAVAAAAVSASTIASPAPRRNTVVMTTPFCLLTLSAECALNPE